KEIGEWVLAGENIAKVGNTGGQEVHALYFEIRHNGKPTNPKPWLKRKG
ncbi:MAG: peptidoglycan DD-metalloendopeptidase family protein, partial [Porticoccus sp.]|nr:peptidoglycan DD-metalloendopeptidase family protein [Porticoccus sp.]